VQHKLAGIAGNVWYAEKSADMSDHNFTRTRDEVLKLAGGATNQLILKHIHNGARDSVAAKRMLSNLLGEVISMQKGMFGTEIIAHPEWTKEQLLPHNPKEIP